MLHFGKHGFQTEIHKSGGGLFFVRWRADPIFKGGVEKAAEDAINPDFWEYASRGYTIVARYYDELDLRRAGHPRDPRLHTGNVLAAQAMASAGLGAMEGALKMCTASADQSKAVADALFVAWRDSFGRVGTSPMALDEAEIEEANRLLAMTMELAAREARCRVPIIIA